MISARDKTDSLAMLRRVALEAPMLDAETERTLIRRYRLERSRTALDALVRSHLRLVLATARKFSGLGVPLEDLVSEGNLGLVHAVDRFDLDRDTRFAGYAVWWIRAYVRRYTLRNRRIVALPSTRNARRVIAGMAKAERAISQRRGGPATIDDIAEELGVPAPDVSMVAGALNGRDIPTTPIAEGQSHEVVDGAASPEEDAGIAEEHRQNAAAVRHALRALDPRERHIVERRLLGDDDPTLATLGSSLGVSRERVRQLETRAHMKLRNALLDLVA